MNTCDLEVVLIMINPQQNSNTLQYSILVSFGALFWFYDLQRHCFGSLVLVYDRLTVKQQNRR